MNIPGWLKGLIAVWVAIGIPSFFLGWGFRGRFSLLPDPPPILWAPGLLDQTVGTLFWAVGIFVVYMPVFVVPLLLVWRWRNAGKTDA